ncbi:MAG: hypothetical protein JJ873_16100 [Maricaulis sp.]|uniref:hypothetical protein n=1 Tax=Maricaulis sp. TaxID=1486257 RepID=UPI001B13E71F|nr:hypothetical protein [Maricaulis sp.]MBO6731108.1 hypothetical protein [Maricaulis sp.]MBO6878904.1 hypothetical protein [Maricaulis sp.]
MTAPEPGQPGDLEEIHNCCLLLRDCLSLIVDHEEGLRFMHLPEEFDELKGLLQGAIGSQIKQFESIPDMLDGIVTKYVDHADFTNSDPVVISHEIVFDLPDGWSRKVSRELNRLPRKLAAREKSQNASGCLSTIVLPILIFFLAILLFG